MRTALSNNEIAVTRVNDGTDVPKTITVHYVLDDVIVAEDFVGTGITAKIHPPDPGDPKGRCRGQVRTSTELRIYRDCQRIHIRVKGDDDA